jgi:hypothetical protein
VRRRERRGRAKVYEDNREGEVKGEGEEGRGGAEGSD